MVGTPLPEIDFAVWITYPLRIEWVTARDNKKIYVSADEA